MALKNLHVVGLQASFVCGLDVSISTISQNEVEFSWRENSTYRQKNSDIQKFLSEIVGSQENQVPIFQYTVKAVLTNITPEQVARNAQTLLKRKNNGELGINVTSKVGTSFGRVNESLAAPKRAKVPHRSFQSRDDWDKWFNVVLDSSGNPQGDSLGRGTNGQVIKVSDRDGNSYALKRFCKGNVEFQKLSRDSESEIVGNLDHANIAKCVCKIDYVPSKGEPKYYICYEFVEGETLQSRMKKGIINFEVGMIGNQLIGILGYLKGQGIVHRDLKPDNIMIHGGLLGIKITVIDWDLGINNNSSSAAAGTPFYMSPRTAWAYLTSEEVKYTHCCDSWSVVAILQGILFPEFTCVLYNIRGEKIFGPEYFTQLSKIRTDDMLQMLARPNKSNKTIKGILGREGNRHMDDAMRELVTSGSIS